MARNADRSHLVRLAALRLVFFIFLLGIVARLFQLQVVNFKLYEALASGQHDLFAQLLPERGQIFIADPLGQGGRYPVAVNVTRRLIYAIPKEIKDASAVAAVLAPELSLDAALLANLLDKPNDPYEPLAHGVADDIAAKVEALKIKGIASAPEVMRYYPEAEGLSQTTGFVGFVGDHRQGQYGVEQQWEKILAGVQGELRSERDAGGTLVAIGEHQLTSAVDGSNLLLTIDKSIQFRACTALQRAVEKHGARSGSLVILEPATGAVRAICNAPGFDPNQYAQVESVNNYANGVISEAYEPGSVFKPITMAAALENGALKPDSTYTDTGEVRIGPDVIRNSDFKSHGVQTMTQVLEESLNTGAIYAMRQAGQASFANMVQKFGFGERTGIELPSESPGNLRSLKEKREIYYATASFGQGITTTPLQLATAFGTIANAGKMMQPYLVQQVEKPTGQVEVTKPVVRRQVLSPRIATMLSAMLVAVVENGHGKRAGVPGYFVAGKTGTAEIPNPEGGYAVGRNIGTFVGFAPVESPKFVMVVKITEPKDVVFAESSAAPVFGEVAKFLLQYYQVPPARALPAQVRP